MYNLFIFSRTNITNIIILICLLLYNRFSFPEKSSHRKNYSVILHLILGHVIFGMITEFTVNTQELPKWINDTCHFFFFVFGDLVCVEYFRYIISMVHPAKRVKREMFMAYIYVFLSALSIPVCGIYYEHGEITWYSQGMGASLGFATAYLIFISAMIIFTVNIKRIEKIAILSLFPPAIIILILLTLQIIYPEFLITESVMTILALSILFTTENPAMVAQQKAFIDYTTGLYNRNCYENDCLTYRKNTYSQMAFVMCDLNNLKKVNDSYSHLEGDNYILSAANILSDSLKTSYKLYRIGGDEFVAIYLSDTIKNVEREISLVQKSCDASKKIHDIPIQIAIGCAYLEENEDFDHLAKRADELMYQNKNRQKANS